MAWRRRCNAGRETLVMMRELDVDVALRSAASSRIDSTTSDERAWMVEYEEQLSRARSPARSHVEGRV
jgi:hypothetical protein